jgi:hypothetical protein
MDLPQLAPKAAATTALLPLVPTFSHKGYDLPSTVILILDQVAWPLLIVSYLMMLQCFLKMVKMENGVMVLMSNVPNLLWDVGHFWVEILPRRVFRWRDDEVWLPLPKRS